ncbi:MAG: chemotaxis-specific protein-glutamate methyltransferase CheB, partial [Candidatus Thorarchaeota archaeon]
MTIDVVIADDSAFLRKNIADILKSHELINLIEFAENGEEAIHQIKLHNPDVLVLDLVMPKMNGLDAFKVIMEDHPTPTVILSAINPKDLNSSIQALLMGAFDYIIKPGGIGAKDLPRFREELLAKVLLASQSQIKRIFRNHNINKRKGLTIRQDIVDEIFDFGRYLNKIQPIQEEEEQEAHIIEIRKTEPREKKVFEQISKDEESSQAKSFKLKINSKANNLKSAKKPLNFSLKKSFQFQNAIKETSFTPNLTLIKEFLLEPTIIVIGASVGGPRTITTILRDIPRNFPAPILIVQHLSSHFTEAFADNLDLECNIKIKVAADGDLLKPGVGYIAPGEKHMEVSIQNEKYCVKVYKGTPINFCMPSIDVLFSSAAKVYRNRTIGVLLTGMGSDGVNGLNSIQKVCGKTIAESEETCILYAMPKFAAEKGFADFI